jgi:hypothetical protein
MNKRPIYACVGFTLLCRRILLLKYSVHDKPAVGVELWKRDAGISVRVSKSFVVTLALVIMSESSM